MIITLLIISILLLIYLIRFWTAAIFQLKIAKDIQDNIAQAMLSYCILDLVSELKEFQDKVCNLIDNLLDINKTVKVAVSFKKINLQCFLTDEEIEFLEHNFYKKGK